MQDMDTKFREQLSKRYPEKLEKSLGIQRGALDFEDLKKRDIVLFGAGQNGPVALKAFEKQGVPVRCFADNDPSKQGTELCGVKILSPEQAVGQFPGASFFITTPRFSMIAKQLTRLGILKIHDCCELFLSLRPEDIEGFPAYQTRTNLYQYGVVFEREINNLRRRRNSEEIVFSILNLFVTEKCTLRCRECSSRIPYISNPREVKFSELIAPVEKLVEAVDLIGEFGIAGGEALLYSDLHKVIDYMVKIDKIKNIYVLSNGTLIPDSETLESLRHEKVSVQFSDYGPLSRNLEKLTNLFAKNDIKYNVKPVVWHKFPPVRFHDRSEQELERIYEQCTRGGTDCPCLSEGRYYCCSFARTWERLGLIPVSESNSIDIPKPF